MAAPEVRSKDTAIGPSGRKYESRTCGICSVHHPTRRLFIDFIEWPWFDRVILVLIVLNCTFLAVQGPPGSPDAMFDESSTERIEIGFTILFTLEMISKWIAMGIGRPVESRSRGATCPPRHVPILAGGMPP